MNKFKAMLALGAAVTVLAACSKDKNEPVVVPPPSDGSTLTLNGLIGAEAGSSAGNSVYVDFSANKQTAVDRDSWDLGFYSGADFKVILNASNGSSVIKVDKTDLNAVTAADFDANSLKVGQGGGTFALIDDPREANILNKTAIGAVEVTDAANKVYIVNRKGGANNVLATTDLFKIRVLRKGNGYTLQYAKVGDATFKTLDITKNASANFQFASLVKGATVNVEPEKASWDIVWGYSMYYTATFPYAFSDLVFVNNLAGVTAAAVATSTKTYAAFGEADVAGVTFSNARDIIGSTWRNTTGTAIGVKTDIFYVVKDGAGNVYKLKFNSFISNDGGERGKPVIEYKLVKKG